jgi:4-diphosphocytidyl-2-C-methyl-D-erythritol kinase
MNLIYNAYAKINISLDVVGKREDGYHLVKMIMQNIDISDTLSFNIAKKGINITCNKSYVPTDQRNLVYKGVNLFMDRYGITSGIDINIVKNIPVSAGLAGGSSDAATALKAMRDLFKPEIEDSELMKLGLKIGADVPYCIKGGTCLCEGIGEIITPLKPFKGYHLVLVKPNFGVSTKEVYSSLDIKKIFKHPEIDNIIKYMDKGDYSSIALNMRNVLENVTLSKYNILRKIKSELIELGALGALMSGSGPTIFGLFQDSQTAQNCHSIMEKKYKEVYLTKTI